MNIRHLRNLALIGALGAAIMLVGDFLYYLTPFKSGVEFSSAPAMRHMSPERLAWGAAAGPIAGLLYAIGSCVFYAALKPHNRILAILISAGFVLMWTLAGAYHAIYAVVGFIDSADTLQLVPLVRGKLIGTMYIIGSICGIMASIAFVYMVLRHKTVFPKWIIVCLPILWAMLQGGIKPFIPSPLGSIVVGGWPNWCFLAFFLLLAWVWRRKTT